MTKFVLVFFMMVGLIMTSGFNAAAHQPDIHVTGEAYAHISDTGAHGHTHDDELGQNDTIRHVDHDPADHSHQVMFFHPETGDQLPRRKNDWFSAQSTELKPDQSGRIDRPPQISGI